MLVSQDDQKAIIEAFVVLKKARDELDKCVPSSKVVTSDLAIMATINLINVVVGQVYTHPFVYSGYTVNYLKKVNGTLGGAYSKKQKELTHYPIHKYTYPAFNEGDNENSHST